MISFGPFLIRASGKSLAFPHIENTGYALEFSSAHKGVSVPIYRRTSQNQGDLTDYLFHEKDAPFSLRYQPYYSSQTSAGLYLPLESLLLAVYQDRQVSRPITDFLSEFRACLPIERTPLFPNSKATPGFKPNITELGFYPMDFFSYGRMLTVFVAWFCPQDRSSLDSAPYFSAGAVEFRPRPDRTLNEGKWIEPVPGRLYSLLRDVLRKASPGGPLNLLSEEGKELLLKSFKWTRLARMSHAEARLARVEFARQHPELLDKPRELARAMRKAGLYAETTATGQIVKNLGAIIVAAKK